MPKTNHAFVSGQQAGAGDYCPYAAGSLDDAAWWQGRKTPAKPGPKPWTGEIVKTQVHNWTEAHTLSPAAKLRDL